MTNISLSWSRYQSHLACPLQHHLRYNQKIRLPKNERPYFRGSIVHELMKLWAWSGFKDGVVRQELPTVFKAQLSRISVTSKEEVIALFKKAVDAALKAEKLYTRLEFPSRVAPASVERRFYLPIPGFPENVHLTGSMDVDDVSRGIIFDLKNAEQRSNHENPIQLMVYGLAKKLMGEDYGRAAFLYPLVTNRQTLGIRFGEEDLDSLQEDLAKFVATIIRADEPEATPGQACYMCEFRGTYHCPATFKTGTFERDDSQKPYEVTI